MKQLISSAWYGVQSGFLKTLGNIKYFSWPLFFVYDPKGYQVKGDEVREVINLIQPGDILLRGYDKYLSGVFIPGYFSHAGLYLGAVTEEDKAVFAPSMQPEQLERFRTGEQMVAHAMAQGVFMEDVINFCRCDRMVVLRFPESFAENVKTGSGVEPMEKLFSVEEYNLFRDLKAGQSLRFEDVFPVIFHTALMQLAKPYDYRFDFENYNDLSCTEYVQSCIKALAPYHGIEAIEQHYFGLLKKRVIEPDAFYRDCFEQVWASKTIDPQRLPAT
ncbi:MAG: YiiX/YebB-like N1pC/P60 family cysteine hydrolase [Thiolinea sp.]